MRQLRGTKQPTHLLFPSVQNCDVCCLLTGISKVAQHCIEGVGEGKIKLPFLSWQNVREVLGQGSQLILSQIVETLVPGVTYFAYTP